MRNLICGLAIGLIVAGLWVEPRRALAEEAVVPLLGDIRTEPISKVGPRNRTDFGIGEDVRLWIGSFGEGIKAADLTGEITWIVGERDTVLPILGETTTLSVGLSATEGVITIQATYWEPEAVTVPIAADNPRQPNNRVPKAGRVIGYDDLAWKVASELQTNLTILDRLRNGRKTDFAKVEIIGAELLAKDITPKDRALIHFQIAHNHAQSGLVQPQSVIDHAAAALKLPLEPRNRLKLFVYIGDAYRVLNRKHSFAVRRKQATAVYLEGLKEVLKYELPDRAPDLPVSARILGFSDGGDDGETRLKGELLMKLHRKARFQREMIHLQTILARQIVSMYSRKPFAIEELDRQAKDILADSAAVNRLTKELPADAKQSTINP